MDANLCRSCPPSWAWIHCRCCGSLWRSPHLPFAGHDISPPEPRQGRGINQRATEMPLRKGKSAILDINERVTAKSINTFHNLANCALGDKLDRSVPRSDTKEKQSTRKMRHLMRRDRGRGENSSRQQYPPTSSLPRVRMWVGNGGCRQNVGPRFFAAACEKTQCCPLWSPLLGVCCGGPQWVPARSVNEDTMRHGVSSGRTHTRAPPRVHLTYIHI